MAEITKDAFLKGYRVALLEAFPWAADEARLDRFMANVERTITTQAVPWNWDSDTALKVLRGLGFKGRLTLKGLRALA